MSVRAWSLASALLACTTTGPDGAATASTGDDSASAEPAPTSTGADPAPTSTGADPAPTSTGTTSETGDATGETTAAPGGSLVLVDGTVVGRGVADLRVEDGVIVEVGEISPGPGDEVVDLAGRWLAPAFIDSHVHLLYLPQPMELARGGIAGAVDLAAPVEIFDTDLSPLRMVAAGPMVTALQGYPTQSWGANGYGIECADAAAATAAVELLHDLGAGVIKLPVTGSAQLDAESLVAATARAHELGLLVVSHALSDLDARNAALAGADVLAHTPTSALSEATIAAWSGRAVISTLRAFGGSQAAVDNLAALRAAGVTVLYGTDFGNSSTARIDPGELALLQQAGMSPAEILAAGTSVPAALWEPLSGPLGALEVGKDASLLVLSADPLASPATLSTPERVYIRGARVDGG